MEGMALDIMQTSTGKGDPKGPIMQTGAERLYAVMKRFNERLEWELHPMVCTSEPEAQAIADMCKAGGYGFTKIKELV